MDVEGQITTWSGERINLVTQTPNIDVGFGLGNYRKKFLAKVLSYIVWVLSGSPEEIGGIDGLHGVHVREIHPEIKPMYYRTYGREIPDSQVVQGLKIAVKNHFLRRVPIREGVPNQGYLYYPTRVTLDRKGGWKRYYWRGLEDRFKPTWYKQEGRPALG